MSTKKSVGSTSEVTLNQGYRNVVVALRDAGQFDLAEFVAVDIMKRFTEDVELACEYAWVAHHRHDWAGAVERWKSARQKFPDLSVAYWMEAGLLLEHLGRYDEAEQILKEGVERFPEHSGIAIDFASAANAREDWSTARERWHLLCTRYPQDQAVYDGSGAAEFGYSQAVMDQNIAEKVYNHPSLIPKETSNSTRNYADLMSGFQSIGENCEFGLVQRHFGAEPLDLLRWNSITVSNLIQALNDDFKNIGDPASTVLNVHEGEYILQDHRYGTVMHTFLRAVEQKKSAAQLYVQMCRRAQYLKDKIVQDLRTGERVFVYKSYPAIPSKQLFELHDALNRYGSNTLLHVVEAEEGQPSGFVDCIRDNLFVGYLDNIVRADRGWADLSFAVWADICSAMVVDR